MTPELEIGLGLRREHYASVANGESRVDWFEVISENFMGCGGTALATLERVRARHAVSLHGVSLSIGSCEALDGDYLDALAALVARIEPTRISDHLCWTGIGGVNTHDLLPLPYTEEALQVVVDNVNAVQDRLGRRLLLENVSSYLTFSASTMPEWEFLDTVAARAGCGILLDINNIYVSARNHGFDPRQYLAGIRPAHVAEFHLAGHQDHGTHVVDTHDAPVGTPVWQLYAEAVARFGAIPTLLERDDRIPPLAVLEDELRHAVLLARRALAPQAA